MLASPPMTCLFIIPRLLSVDALAVALIISDIPNTFDMRRVMFTYLHQTMTKGPKPKTHVQPGNGPSHVQLNLRTLHAEQLLPLCPYAALRVLNPKRFIRCVIHPSIPHCVPSCRRYRECFALECELAKCQTKLLIRGKCLLQVKTPKHTDTDAFASHWARQNREECVSNKHQFLFKC